MDANIISQLMFAFTERNRSISMESLWRHFKNSKTTRNAIHPSIHTYQKSLNPSGDPVPLRIMYLMVRRDGCGSRSCSPPSCRWGTWPWSQGCGSGSQLDPDSFGASGSGSVFEIRIRIQEGKSNPQKLRNFMLLRAGCSLLRAEGFFCNLDVLYGGLGIGKF